MREVTFAALQYACGAARSLETAEAMVREAAGRQLILRRSRGFAPAPIPAPPVRGSILAYGGDRKGTIAVADRGRIRLSQHLGDLESLESRRAYQQHLSDFPLLCQSEPEGIACDDDVLRYRRRLWALSADPACVLACLRCFCQRQMVPRCYRQVR